MSHVQLTLIYKTYKLNQKTTKAGGTYVLSISKASRSSHREKLHPCCASDNDPYRPRPVTYLLAAQSMRGTHLTVFPPTSTYIVKSTLHTLHTHPVASSLSVYRHRPIPRSPPKIATSRLSKCGHHAPQLHLRALAGPQGTGCRPARLRRDAASIG